MNPENEKFLPQQPSGGQIPPGMAPQGAPLPPAYQHVGWGSPPQHPSAFNAAVPLNALAREPAPVDCPACGFRELTRTELVSGTTTHAWAALLCWCLCLGCIPYLISGLKDVDHYCGHCSTLLARWHRSGRVEVYPPRRR